MDQWKFSPYLQLFCLIVFGGIGFGCTFDGFYFWHAKIDLNGSLDNLTQLSNVTKVIKKLTINSNS